MSDLENVVLEMLIPIFPNLTRDLLEISVQHPSNHGVPLTVDTLLQRCIDDLLELRTFTDKTASYRHPPAAIHSDGRLHVQARFLNRFRLFPEIDASCCIHVDREGWSEEMVFAQLEY